MTARPPSTEELLAATAHDLRLPLSHIKGFVSSLRRDDLEWDKDTRQEFLAEIELETDRLAQMLDALLQSRTSGGGLVPGANLTFTEPASIVKGALHRTRGVLGGRPLRVDVASDLPRVRLDVVQMERVLTNLLQNAVKYSPPGTPIGISACLSGADEVQLAITDEGPGVPHEDRERIFEPFFRAAHTAARSDVPGNGLGLAICQAIVLAHGGRMQVTGRHSGGAQFSVFLPTQAGRSGLTPLPKRGGSE